MLLLRIKTREYYFNLQVEYVLFIYFSLMYLIFSTLILRYINKKNMYG